MSLAAGTELDHPYVAAIYGLERSANDNDTTSGDTRALRHG